MTLESLRMVTQLVVFAAVTVQTVVTARRYRQAGWVAAAFGALTVISLVGLVVPEDVLHVWHDAGQRAQIVLIAVVPYCVWRFTGSLTDLPRVIDAGVSVAAVVLVVATLVLPELPTDAGGTSSVIQSVYVGAFLVYWPAAFAASSLLLWRAGRGEGHLVVRRMRLLSVGAVALGAALLLSAAGDGQSGWLGMSVTGVVIGAGLAFYVGFAPPGWLRAIWRRGPQLAAQEMQTRLVAAASRHQVVSAQVPYIHQLIGVPALYVDPWGEVVASSGLGSDRARQIAVEVAADGEPAGVRVQPLPWGCLVLVADFRAPLFAEEEEVLLAAMVHQLHLGLDRARLYEEERSARQEAEAAQQEVHALLTGIVHDVKTPTATIGGYIDLLRDGRWRDLDDDELEHFVDAIGRASSNLNELANDLVALSRAGQVDTDPQPLQLQRLIEDVAEDVGAAHSNLDVETVGDLPTVHLDAGQARQLFTNLLVNAAVHATANDEVVTVTVTAETGDDQNVIHVTDDGAGIPAEDLDRVFDLFTRGTTTTAEGSGIGLAICQRIVTALGGTIHAHNVPDAGARFTITLPDHAGTEATGLEAPAAHHGTG